MDLRDPIFEKKFPCEVFLHDYSTREVKEKNVCGMYDNGCTSTRLRGSECSVLEDAKNFNKSLK